MSILEKIVNKEHAAGLVRQWQENGKQVVFTNGCFDILHAGHVMFLEEARSLGDKLVIGLNTDASTRRLKGEYRPIQDEISRARILAALASVDLVVLFNEDTPLDLIKGIRPDILVKGGDYAIDDIVGSEEVLSWGGQVKSLRFHKGYATSRIEERILEFHQKKQEKT